MDGAACLGEDDGAQRRAAERSAAVQQEVRYAVARIAHEAGRRERVKVSGKIVDFVAALAENYAAQLTGDVCSFAKHARRSTVTPDDVRLCARNNESIADALGCLLLITSCMPWLFVTDKRVHASVVGDSHGVVTWPARIAVLLRHTLSNQCAYLCADVFERSSAPSTDKGEQIVIWHRGSLRPRSVCISISCLRVVRERISSLWQAEKRDRDTDQAGRKAHRSISNTHKYARVRPHTRMQAWQTGNAGQASSESESGRLQ